MFKNINPKNRVGVVNKNKFGTLMEVVEYKNYLDIWVKFENGNLVHTSWQCFTKGDVKNVYDKSIYGVAYLGEGDYKTVIPNGKHTSIYDTWRGILTRCYSEKWLEKHPTYIGCTICEEWLNFQNFAKWYDDNYYEVEGERIQIDKDILIKGNKLYSPETCIFVPERINLLFVFKSKEGKLPMGVTFSKKHNKYRVSCSNVNGWHMNIGEYDTVEEAFETYKKAKEKVIKQVAELYKSKIPKKLYNAMLTYEIDISD